MSTGEDCKNVCRLSSGNYYELCNTNYIGETRIIKKKTLKK